MGLGKTVTSLAVMLAYKDEWPLLIICPASLRYIWPSEIEKFCPSLPHSAIYVVQGFDDCDFYSNPTKRSCIKIVIATYSLLQNRSAAARVLHQFNFRCIIADESHNLKERNSQRCKLAIPMLRKAKRLLLLSGTPALARPVELWVQLSSLDKDLYGSYADFTARYCDAKRGHFGWDVSGSSNVHELHQLLKISMLRRLKADVLKDLPPKQRSIVPVKIQNPKHIKECSDIMSEWNQIDSSKSKEDEFKSRTLMTQAYQASGIGKAEAVANYVLDWLRGSGTQKLLVFAHHIEVLDIIEAAASKLLKGVGHIRIDGSVSGKDRASRVKRFQTHAQVRLGILSVTAAGVGLTLTAASSVVFAELHWTPGVLSQAEDRIHRMGQVNAANIMYCVCKDKELSVDMTLWGMLCKKINILGRLFDGKKNASLKATTTENKCASSEEELVSFFAENYPTSKSSLAQSKVPVKGSIQSFFIKKKAKISTNSTDGLSSDDYKIKRHVSVTPDIEKRSLSNIQKNEIVSLRPRMETTCSNPASSFRKTASTWLCVTCSYLNTNESNYYRTSCKMCGALRKTVKTDAGMDSSSTKDNTTIDLTCLNDNRVTIDLSCVDDETTIELCSNVDDDEISSGISNNLPSIKTTKSTKATKIKSKFKAEIESSSFTSASNKNEYEKEVSICFNVSQNSGRIAIHCGLDGKSLLFNFDIDDVVCNITSDKILEQQLKRTNSATGQLNMQNIASNEIMFDNLAVKEVVKRLCETNPSRARKMHISVHEKQLTSEIKKFVISFLSLREVEKNAIKKWDVPIKCSSLHETLKKILLPAPGQQFGHSDRFLGGSKEKALERISAGTASQTDKRVLNGLACCWCGKDLPSTSLLQYVQATYCSHECTENGRLRRGGLYASSRIRQQLFSLERGVCQKCGIDANGK
uniref:Uncharacterized protein n=2 Tax=Corethron hystrix TaxID=216773 RepID=A0A7S1FWL3_9STRA|mmetsp:Transcript_35056/g.81084  ORF Transcript_35056/g.81084 Transcript_35056/m.81084 type:complete len:923 (+) Transcript_35056:442-3210(+)